MNLFDAVPTVVKERYDGYVAGDSISTRDFQLTMNEVIDRCTNFTREDLSRDMYMQIRTMVSNAIDCIIHDRRNYDLKFMTDKLIDDLWS